jgi:hypothetical protein
MHVHLSILLFLASSWGRGVASYWDLHYAWRLFLLGTEFVSIYSVTSAVVVLFYGGTLRLRPRAFPSFFPVAPTWSIGHPWNAPFHFSFLISDRRQDSSDGGSACRKAAAYTGQHKHRINADRHPCLEWDSNPRSQCSSQRRQFIP